MMDQPHVSTASADDIKRYADLRAKEHGSFSQHIEAGVLSAFVSMLCAERDALRIALTSGVAAPVPSKGSLVAPVDLGDIPCFVEYSYDAGEPAVMYYRDGSGHPGSPACVEITDLWINGSWTRDLSCIDSETIERWEDQILEREQSAECDAEAESADRYRDERKDAALMGDA
jgi:hypothetical protein